MLARLPLQRVEAQLQGGFGGLPVPSFESVEHFPCASPSDIGLDPLGYFLRPVFEVLLQ